ncbi:TadE/TadG family type IV pilus assembly protein [Roseibium sp.]|uniref:TadE/TadG family type IV pilus assembly protein n=1 Tax=Roseibium sp. TaxID=1936156 RepID=UPI003A97586D
MPSFFFSTLRKFSRDTAAIAAVEFALVLPFLLILLIGVAETTSALNHDRKVTQIAGSVSDLVAQAEQISVAEMQDIMLAAERIIEPYDTSRLSVTVASITFDEDGNPEVDWSVDKDGNSPWAEGEDPAIDFPETIAVPGTSVILGSTSYTYVPTFASLLQNLFPRATSINLTDQYFLHPRLTTKVLYPG